MLLLTALRVGGDYRSFGSVVGDSGDVDGDGVPDFVVGDPIVESGRALGTFWIASGKTGAVLRRIVLPDDGTPDPDGGGAFFRVHGQCRFDADETPDLLIAAQRYSDRSAGTVYLVAGKTGEILRTIKGHGSRGGGDWARIVGDFDHDGTSDVGVLDMEPDRDSAEWRIHSGASGAVLWKRSLRNECAMQAGGWLVLGSAERGRSFELAVVLDGRERCTASLSLYASPAEPSVWVHSALPSPCVRAFAELKPFGDLDRDGVTDLAVSFCDATDVVSGKTGDLLIRLEPRSKGDSERGYGWRLASIGDIDRDGSVDLAITEIEDGVFSGSVEARSGSDGRVLWRASGEHDAFGEAYHLGYDLAPIGDVDGDGVCDLVAGTWEGASGEPGRARLISGKNGSQRMEIRRRGDDLVVIRPKTESPTPR